MTIPSILWLIADLACIAGLLRWHKAAPSRHLVMMMGGLVWTAALILPWIFEEMFGMDRLSESLGEKSADAIFRYGHLFSWIGAAFFALGLWRLAKSDHPGIPTQPQP